MNLAPSRNLVVCLLFCASVVVPAAVHAQEIVVWGNDQNGIKSIAAGVKGATAISAGEHHLLALMYDGTVIALGNNDYGQCNVPAGLEDVIAIEAGFSHSLALKADGTVVAWGMNDFGQCNVPSGLTNVIAVAGGFRCSLALKANGTVVAWGDNTQQQLDIPSSLNNVIAIDAAYTHCVALKADGTIVQWGGIANASAPPTVTNVIAISAGDSDTMVLKSDGTVVSLISNSVPAGLANVMGFSAAQGTHFMALKADGTVTAWGNNDGGQTNVPAGLTDVIAVSGGGNFSVALRSITNRIKVFATGFANEMETLPAGLEGARTVSLGALHGLVLKSNGEVTVWGNNSGGQLNIPAGTNNVKAISASGYANTVLRADGTLTSWAIPELISIPPELAGVTKMISCSYNYCVALKADGTAVSWGDNTNQQATVPALTNVKAVAAGFLTGTALKADGTIVKWALFQPATPPAAVNIKTISPAYLGSVTLKSDGTALAWGDGGNYQPVVGVTGIASMGTRSGTQKKDVMGVQADGTPFLWPGTAHALDHFPATNTIALSAHGSDKTNVLLTLDLPLDMRGSFAATYVENAPAVPLQNALTIRGNDGVTNIASATVSISEGFTAGDVLSVTTAAGIVSNYDAGTGILTLTGNALIADYQSVLQTITFSGTNAGTTASRIVSIKLNNGTADVSTLSTFIGITPVNDVPSFTKGNDITINEDAPAHVASGWATNISKGADDESTQTLTFNVANNNSPLFSVQPAINASGELTFTPATNAVGIATVTLSLSDNGGTSNGGVNRSADQTFTITINAVNDAPSFTKGSNITANEDAGTRTISGWATSISKGPVDESSQTLTFNVSNNNTALFSVQPAVNNLGVLTFTSAADASGVATVTLSLSDNGGTANGGVDKSADQTFTITVNAVNDAPFFALSPSLSLHEDTGTQSVGGWVNVISAGPGESSQQLNFVVSNNNNALFSVQPTINSSGVLNFNVAPDAHGTATVTVILKDDGGTAFGGVDESAAQTFSFTIDPVNDAPSFSKGADVMVNEDAGPQTMNSWATAISRGPINESSQTLTFNISNDNTSLFSVQPAIGVTGTLTFTTATNAFGTATITLSLSDDGGTINGGVAQSAEQAFTITVNAVNDMPSFAKGTDVAVNEDAGAQTITGWATNIQKGPGEDGQTISFETSSTNSSIFSSAPTVNEAGVLSFTPAQNASGISTVTIAVKDDGGTSNGGIDKSANQSFTITINPVNDAPSFAGSDITINEDAGAQNIPNWLTNISAGSPDEASQTISFSVSNNNNSLFATQPAVSATGDITFQPAANKAGIATITVSAKDNGGYANGGSDESTQTFTITIESVNDAPSFTAGGNVTVNEDAAAYNASWATSISGGEGESDQALSFFVTATNTALFTTQPTLNASGALSFKLAADAFGSSTVNVSLHDDGGTARGGVDKTETKSFNITALAVNDPPRIDPINDVTVTAGAESYVIELTGLDPGTGEESQQLTLQATSGDASLVSVSDIASSGSNGTITLVPSATTGTTTITLLIKDNGGIENGGQDQTSITINISVEEAGINHTVYIPNLFSPDGNGVNDTFRVRTKGVAEIRFTVFDANGKEVFSTNDITVALERGWDGRHNGSIQPTGTYVWTLTGKYVDGSSLTDSKNRYGQVILVR